MTLVLKIQDRLSPNHDLYYLHCIVLTWLCHEEDQNNLRVLVGALTEFTQDQLLLGGIFECERTYEDGCLYLEYFDLTQFLVSGGANIKCQRGARRVLVHSIGQIFTHAVPVIARQFLRNKSKKVVYALLI